jgi:diguanylate cyclase (GGDEF)-like protein/putative nucleotidyltransferase with HDIG domain
MTGYLYRQNHWTTKTSEAVITTLGLCVFIYSVCRTIQDSVAHSVDWDWIIISLITVLLISRADIKLVKTSSAMTLADTIILASVLLYGTSAAVALAGVDNLIRVFQKKHKNREAVFHYASMTFAFFVAGHTLNALQANLKVVNLSWEQLALSIGILSAVHLLVYFGLTTLSLSLRRGIAFLMRWKEIAIWTGLSYFVSAAVACIFIKLIASVSLTAFVTTAPILTITYLTYKTYIDRVEVTNRHAENVADLHLRTIEALAIAIDAKDEVTHDHVRRVQIYATGLAKLFGLSDKEVEALKAGALLHDIGKLAVPDYILNKPGPLTPAEFDKMKVHTVVGSEILERVGFPYPVAPVVRHHHERWDGRGYPDGLKGDEIPITARILSVSDCFDAVREERQYRGAMSREEAITLLRENASTMFDPAIVKAFLNHLDEFESEIREQGIQLQSFTGKKEILEESRESRNETGSFAFEKIRSAHREVTTLYEIAQTIGTSLDLRDTFAVFSSRLLDIVSYTTCVLYLVRRDSTDIEAAHVAGRNIDLIKGKKMPSAVGVAGWVVANNHAMYNSDPHLDFDALRIEIPEEYLTAAVVPMMREGKMVGALALYSSDVSNYDADQLRLVEAVAKLSADAIANAVHHEKTQESALTDALTGLPNKRALRLRFDEDSDRAIRHNDHFCIVMMDLDGFKSINDQLGHQAGDNLLIEASRLLVAQIRSTDFICRYAGDEFVAILQVGADEAKEMVHRIQRALERHDFRFGRTDLSVGISAGFACFNSDGSTLDELLLAADRAMYSDKMSRKKIGQAAASKTTSLNEFKIV